MIKSKYNPENGIVSLWNCLNIQQRYDYTLLDLDTNLCFTKGWIDFPPKGYGELRLVNKCSDGIICSEKEHQQNRRSTFVIVE